MTEFQLDPRPFFVILHNLFRHDDLDYDPEHAGKVVEWVRTNNTMLHKTTSQAEFGVVMAFYAYWKKHKIAPDRKLMTDLVHALPRCQPMLDTLAAYDHHAEDLEIISHLSLDAYLDMRKLDYEKYKLITLYNTAQQIVLGSLTMPDKKTMFTGPRDALKFIHQKAQEGILLDDQPTKGGVLADTAPKIKERYEQNETDRLNNNLFIPTGISLIDDSLGGLRRKEFNGILGYVAQRKTGVVRTIGYNAAAAGFRVLHIPLESDYDEEETAYSVIHGSYFSGAAVADISKTRIDRGLLSKEEKATFFEVVVPSYQKAVAENIVVYAPATRSWQDVREIIERETEQKQVDLVIIDYITMLSTPGNRDDIADKMAIVQDVKRLAMTANNGNGLCIITPVQGNRDGFDHAATNEGTWTTTGIAKYSELDKSMDNVFYVFFDDEMNLLDRMKMGSCKTRRGQNIPATFVKVNSNSGRVEDLDIVQFKSKSAESRRGKANARRDKSGTGKERERRRPLSQDLVDIDDFIDADG